MPSGRYFGRIGTNPLHQQQVAGTRTSGYFFPVCDDTAVIVKHGALRLSQPAARGHHRSTVLLVAYSLGLGVSFLAVGLAMGKLTRTLEWFKRHSRAITLVSAVILAVFGIILLTNSLPTLTARMSDALRSNGFGWLVDAG